MNAVDELNLLLGIGPPKPKLPITLERSGYSAIRTLGKGAFGQAYLVFNKNLNKYYVAKHINMTTMSHKQRKEAHNEIAIIQQFDHPNIVKYVECFEEHPHLYIIMEYADGGDLYSHLKKLKTTGEKMTETQVIALFTQVAMAVKHMHDRRILHRDIKTQNIFLTKSHVVKVGDFGISTVLQNTMAMAKTMCGTPCYFSPCLVAGLPYNNKSDIWALGVLLYEMAANRLPFESTNMKKLMDEITTAQPPRIPREYSDDLWALIQAMLQKDPARRPDINAVLRFAALQRQLPAIVEQMNGLVPVPSPSSSNQMRRDVIHANDEEARLLALRDRLRGIQPMPALEGRDLACQPQPSQLSQLPPPPPRGVVLNAREAHRQLGGIIAPPPAAPPRSATEPPAYLVGCGGAAVMIPASSDSPVEAHAPRYDPILLRQRDDSCYDSSPDGARQVPPPPLPRFAQAPDVAAVGDSPLALGSGAAGDADESSEYVQLATVIRNMVSVSVRGSGALPSSEHLGASVHDTVRTADDTPAINDEDYVVEDFDDPHGMSIDVAHLKQHVAVVDAARQAAATSASETADASDPAADGDASFSGRCLCGGVAYAGWLSCVYGSFTSASPLTKGFTGAAAVELLHLPDMNFQADLLVVNGTLGYFRVPGTAKTTTYFCKQCGSSLGMILDGVEGCVLLKATLDEPSVALINNRLS